jgi:predicted nucleic acid-binding protein
LRVVIDSNIFVSALLSPAGPPFLIVRAWIAGKFELVTSEEQVAEVRRVSRYAKLRGEFAPYEAGELINDMKVSVYTGRIPRTAFATIPTIRIFSTWPISHKRITSSPATDAPDCSRHDASVAPQF